MFEMMPEFILESILDIMSFELKSVFILRNLFNCFRINSATFAQNLRSDDSARNFLVFLCNLQYLNNPFMMAKIVDIVFLCCGGQRNTAVGYDFFSKLTRNEYAYTHMFPQLVKFYVDIESTGANSEFYDKFNIRRSIQAIFHELWQDTLYRSRMIEIAKFAEDQFLIFI